MKWKPTVPYKIILGEHGVQPDPSYQPEKVEREVVDFPGMDRPKSKFMFKDRRGRKYTWDGKLRK